MRWEVNDDEEANKIEDEKIDGNETKELFDEVNVSSELLKEKYFCVIITDIFELFYSY